MVARANKLYIPVCRCRLKGVSLQISPLEMMMCCICVVVKVIATAVYFYQGGSPRWGGGFWNQRYR